MRSKLVVLTMSGGEDKSHQSRRAALRSLTVRLDADTACLLENVAIELHWSTSRLIGQLVECSKPTLAEYERSNDLAGLFAHLTQNSDKRRLPKV